MYSRWFRGEADYEFDLDRSAGILGDERISVETGPNNS